MFVYSCLDSDSNSSDSCTSTENGDSNSEYSSSEESDTEELDDIVDGVELRPEEIRHLNLLVGGYPLK